MNFMNFFKDFADFQQYVDGLTADTTLQQLRPSISSVGVEIEAALTDDVCEALSDEDESHEGRDLMKAAIASGAMLKFQIINAIKKNGSNASIYKYQHEELKDHYAEAYHRCMDMLLDWLDKNPEYGGFKDSQQYIDRQELPISNARQFNRYYGIDNSSCFFSKVVFIMRQVWNGILIPTIGRHIGNEAVLEQAKTALCYFTMARAVLQFDATELPRSIRREFSHEYARDSQMPDRQRLHDYLELQAKNVMAEMQSIIKLESQDEMAANSNEECDKFYSLL